MGVLNRGSVAAAHEGRDHYAGHLAATEASEARIRRTFIVGQKQHSGTEILGALDAGDHIRKPRVSRRETTAVPVVAVVRRYEGVTREGVRIQVGPELGKRGDVRFAVGRSLPRAIVPCDLREVHEWVVLRLVQAVGTDRLGAVRRHGLRIFLPSEAVALQEVSYARRVRAAPARQAVARDVLGGA